MFIICRMYDNSTPDDIIQLIIFEQYYSALAVCIEFLIETLR
jgi:hypothetical protein